MAKLPTVAIIGRPNTGKSTLFNRLIGHRKAIVSDIPGTTRDHVAEKVEGGIVDYLLVDTGGMGGGTNDKELEQDVHRQSQLALEHADLILLTVNSQEQLTSSDFHIVDILRKRKRDHVSIIIALTKCDNPNEIDELVPPFYELGLTDRIIPISAIHNTGLDDLRSAIEEELTSLHFAKAHSPFPIPHSHVPRIAIIGKPNVGKSSIVNAFMSESQREKSPLLVSEIPGTTRDAVDTVIRTQGESYCFVDTAGIKRLKQTEPGIETYAYFRSIQALEHADICVLVLDARQPVFKQDKRIAGMAIEEGKGLVILLNKIDLLNAEQKQSRLNEISEELQFCRFAPVLPVSATTREGLLKLFVLLQMIERNRTRRIPTKELNQWYRDAVIGHPLGQLTRSKFITQSEELPPTFVLFVKDPKRVQVAQLKYLENNLRRVFGFEGTPVRWITKVAEAVEATM